MVREYYRRQGDWVFYPGYRHKHGIRGGGASSLGRRNERHSVPSGFVDCFFLNLATGEHHMRAIQFRSCDYRSVPIKDVQKAVDILVRQLMEQIVAEHSLFTTTTVKDEVEGLIGQFRDSQKKIDHLLYGIDYFKSYAYPD